MENLSEYEIAFSAASIVAMLGWLVLLASPWIPTWSQRVGGVFIPVFLALGYAVSVVLSSGNEGGFGSLAEVMRLFSQPASALTGWVHFLCFDLLIGAWMCRKAREQTLHFGLVVPCLFFTFLLGPLGLLVFLGLSALKSRGAKSPAIS